MKWRKGLLMMLVCAAAVVGNGVDALATTPGAVAPTTGELTVPDQDKITLEYEGNNASESYNYYRLSVKYSAASEALLTVPKDLVIYQKNITPGEESAEREVHRAAFGDYAGKALNSIGHKPFLMNFDAFYYRNFIVKYNPKGKYEYRAVLTWKNLDTGVESIREVKTEVTVNKEVVTQALMVGTKNNFSREPWVGAYDKDIAYMPKKYTESGTGKEYGYAIDYDTGNLMYNAIYDDAGVKTHNAVYAIVSEESLMDKVGWNSNHIDVSSVPLEGGGSINKSVFIANASLETHVIYTGAQMPGKEIKVYIDNPVLQGNSRELGSKREIKALSEALTRLVQESQENPSYTEGVYPKEHVEVYMGMGTGPQGDIAPGDKKNDMSFIFGETDGTIHGNIQLLITDDSYVYDPDNPTAPVPAVPGFVFDFIKLTYNPFIFTGGVKAYGDSYVKPEGFLMLNKKINFEEALITANEDASLTEAQIIAAGKIDAASGSKMRISLKELLESDLNEYTIFLNKDGTPFDGSSINLTVDGKVIKLAGTPGLPADAITYEYEPLKKQIIIDQLGGFTPKPDYTIKLIIPTKRNTAFNKTVTDYNTNIFAAGKTYPLKIEIIEDHPLLVDSNDELVRYTINNTIKPYKMPGIN